MAQALRRLFEDFLSAITFFAVYALTGSLYPAVGLAMAIGIGQVIRLKLLHRPIHLMQWISLGLVVIFGAMTLLLQTPRLMMMKPSIGHTAFALIMLRRGWMRPYLPPIAQQHVSDAVIVGAGYAWSALLAGIAAANIVVAYYCDFSTWLWFVGFGAFGAKIVAFLAQYLVFRAIIRRRLRQPLPVPVAGLMIVAAMMLFAGDDAAAAVGFQRVAVPDPEGPPIELAIWYPSDAPATSRPLGLFDQVVATDALVAGSRLPLVVISHGTGGGNWIHYDTALALAETGFIAAAVTHTGDNWRDHAYSFTRRNFVERPRHLKLALDYLLTSWSGHDHIAAERIGAFGHSAGAYTVLVAIGGEPELDRLSSFCNEHADDWGCQHARQRPLSAGATALSATLPVWVQEPRIRAAVIAAPAAGHAFTPSALVRVAVPVQLWQAERDQIAPNRWSAENIRMSLPAPPENHVVPLAGHFAFLAPCNSALAERAPEICQELPGFDRVTFHHEFNRSVAAFFAANLSAR